MPVDRVVRPGKALDEGVVVAQRMGDIGVGRGEPDDHREELAQRAAAPAIRPWAAAAPRASPVRINPMISIGVDPLAVPLGRTFGDVGEQSLQFRGIRGQRAIGAPSE